MKKLFAIILALLFVFALAACGSGTSSSQAGSQSQAQSGSQAQGGSDPAQAGYKVAFLTMSSEGDYWQQLEKDYSEAVAEFGITMEVVNADYDPVRQVEQIENAILQDYDMLFVLATDPAAVADACKKAMDAGIPVFAFIKDPGEEYRTCFRGADEGIIGQGIADYASDWATETFGGGEGSCNLIVMGGTSAGSETERYEAVVAAVEADPQFNILETLRVETSQAAAQTATENLLAKYDDINCIIYCSAEMGIGGATYIESDASPIKDFSELGLFVGGLSAEVAEELRNAEAGTAVIRGAINTGGSNAQSGKEIGEQMLRIFNGESFDAFTPVPAVRVDVSNLAEFGY